MARKRTRGKGRQRFRPLVEPNPDRPPNDKERDEWLDRTCKAFVAPSEANKAYYRVVLEELWPRGRSLPGPYVKEGQLRDAIDAYRKKQYRGTAEYKAYADPFRRIRELQGEEGIVGIAREGHRFQLVALDTDPKRVPRSRLPDEEWEKVLERYGHACAVCGRKEPEIRLDQDHKVPRVRRGGDELENWQPLCGECNNFKSTACRGCKLNCQTCPWAFPERVGAPLRLSSANVTEVRSLATQRGIDPHELINDIVAAYLKALL